MKIIIFGANEVGAMITAQFYTTNDITVIDDEKNKLDVFNKFDALCSFSIFYVQTRC